MTIINKLHNYMNTNNNHNRWFIEKIITDNSLIDLINEYLLINEDNDSDNDEDNDENNNIDNTDNYNICDIFKLYLGFHYNTYIDYDIIPNIYNNDCKIIKYMNDKTMEYEYITAFDIIEHYDGTVNFNMILLNNLF